MISARTLVGLRLPERECIGVSYIGRQYGLQATGVWVSEADANVQYTYISLFWSVLGLNLMAEPVGRVPMYY